MAFNPITKLMKKNGKYFVMAHNTIAYGIHTDEEGVITFVNPKYDWMIGKNLFDTEMQERLKFIGAKIKMKRQVKK